MCMGARNLALPGPRENGSPSDPFRTPVRIPSGRLASPIFRPEIPLLAYPARPDAPPRRSAHGRPRAGRGSPGLRRRAGRCERGPSAASLARGRRLPRALRPRRRPPRVPAAGPVGAAHRHPRRVPAPLSGPEHPRAPAARRPAPGEHARAEPVSLPLAADRRALRHLRQVVFRHADRRAPRDDRRADHAGGDGRARLAVAGAVVRRVPAISLRRVPLAHRALPGRAAGVALGHGHPRQRRRSHHALRRSPPRLAGGARALRHHADGQGHAALPRRRGGSRLPGRHRRSAQRRPRLRGAGRARVPHPVRGDRPLRRRPPPGARRRGGRPVHALRGEHGRRRGGRRRPLRRARAGRRRLRLRRDGGRGGLRLDLVHPRRLRQQRRPHRPPLERAHPHLRRRGHARRGQGGGPGQGPLRGGDGRDRARLRLGRRQPHRRRFQALHLRREPPRRPGALRSGPALEDGALGHPRPGSRPSSRGRRPGSSTCPPTAASSARSTSTRASWCGRGAGST